MSQQEGQMLREKKRLGSRGLEALLGKVAAFEDNTNDATREIPGPFDSDDSNRVPSRVDIMLIDRNPHQPRVDFDPAELDALSSSLSTHGLLQPVVVRPNGERFQIIAGERRFRAAVRAGWSDVPVHVIEVDDRQMAELALTENFQRKDLNALEKAAAFARYLEVYGGTHEELAARLALNRSTVTNLIRLLDLPEAVQTMLRKEELTEGHARTLLSLKEREEWEQIEFARRIVSENWSVRQAERGVKEYLHSTGNAEPAAKGWKLIDEHGNRQPVATNDQLRELEQEFRHHLGTKATLTQTDTGKGKLVIPFHSHEEFERIYRWICKSSKYKGTG